MKGQGHGGPRASAWPRRLAQGPARHIEARELESWIIHEDGRLLVVNKPGDVVCHPSKHGPWSSLVGAARERCGLPTMHLVFRLDRETSGVVILAKDPATASRLQRAMQARRVGKAYLAILTGEMRAPVRVDQPLGDDTASPVFMKSAVCAGGQPSVTLFEPLSSAHGITLARVVGDKIYGPDARLYLEFIDRGWGPGLEERLLLARQALHCQRIDLGAGEDPGVFEAALPADMRAFCARVGLAIPPGAAPVA
jgi:23S rRNA pseudouridine1911/1915/1917 synthase